MDLSFCTRFSAKCNVPFITAKNHDAALYSLKTATLTSRFMPRVTISWKLLYEIRK